MSRRRRNQEKTSRWEALKSVRAYGPQMPHPDLGEDEVEITIDHDTGQVSVRGNNLEMMEEAKKMLAEIGIFVE